MHSVLWAVLIAFGMFIGASAILAGTDSLYEWATDDDEDTL